jgi:tetratricopeptide (TPR) repeat protein
VQAGSRSNADLAAAQARVDEARTQADTEPLALIKALTALGDIELGNRNYASAETRYAEALLLSEKRLGPNHASLLDILRGLGYAKAASGQHHAAIPYLQRALPLSRSTFGLFNLDQQGLLQQLARSLTAMGRGAEGQAYMFHMMRAAEKTHGEATPGMVPVLCEVSEWYSGNGQFHEARIMLQGALNILEANSLDGDLSAVEPLRAIASTYMKEASIHPTLGPRSMNPRFITPVDATGAELRRKGPQELSEYGERALQRALNILDATPAASKQTMVETLMQTGDWFQVKQAPAKALAYYKRAWQIIAAEPGLQGMHAQLSSPVRVYYPAPLVATGNLTLAHEAVDVRYVQVEFDIEADGVVANAKVVDHNASKRLATSTLSAIRAARFRPRFVDGEPVPTLAMSYREVFRIRKQETALAR